ncbi:MAG TPA: nucleoside diphosphate kinase regulator [Burkholderiales bacterium]
MATIVNQDIFVTRSDLQRLQRLIDNALQRLDVDASYLEQLAARLDGARPVSPTVVPRDIVTMNSRVRLRLPETGQTVEYTLVFPEDAEPAAGRVSVLAPLGAALLGAREGDEIRWETPAGERTATLEALLYQPEASGDLHL